MGLLRPIKPMAHLSPRRLPVTQTSNGTDALTLGISEASSRLDGKSDQPAQKAEDQRSEPPAQYGSGQCVCSEHERDIENVAGDDPSDDGASADRCDPGQ